MYSVRLISPGEDRAQTRQLRRQVFCQEQGISPEIEFDALDADAWHAVVLDGGKPIATGRLLRLDDGEVKIGRVAVDREYRGKGAGRRVMEALLSLAARQGRTLARVSAQVQAEGFYRALGFSRVSGIYLEDGIPHVGMTRTIEGGKQTHAADQSGD